MIQTKAINITPFIAAAVAHNPRAMQRLEKLVGTRRGEMLALGSKNEFAHHRIVMMGRAEHTISARIMLGFMDTLDDTKQDDQKLLQILRSGWPRVMMEVENEDCPSMESAALHCASRNRDDLSILFMACAILGKSYSKDDEHLDNLFSEWVWSVESESQETGAKYILDGKRYPKKRREYFSSGMINQINALNLNEADSAAFDIAQNITGVDFEAYTDGITLSSEELEAIAHSAKSAEEANAAAYLAMLFKAVNADKKFSLSQPNQGTTARYKAAEQQLRELGVQFDVAKQRIDIIQEQLLAEQERSKRREADQAEQAADLAELAALRNALYQMDADDDDASIQWEKPRELPPHLVSLGGLPTWRAEMGKRIPGAKFIPADVTLPEDTIRAASELWIEPSYLGHSAFYRAVAVAKAAGVPVKYWPGRNVDLCMRAVQTAK